MGHNPALMLGTVDQDRLETAASDTGFMAHLERATRDFDAYVHEHSTWFDRAHGTADGPLMAYFSAEFGLIECLAILAGELGVLAGDHLTLGPFSGDGREVRFTFRCTCPGCDCRDVCCGQEEHVVRII